MERIEDKIKRLPFELQQEVIDFIDFLLEKKKQEKKERIKVGMGRGIKRP